MKTKSYTCAKCQRWISDKVAICDFCKYKNTEPVHVCEFCKHKDFRVIVELLPCLHVVHVKCFKTETKRSGDIRYCPISTCVDADGDRTEVLNDWEEKLIDFCTTASPDKLIKKFEKYHKEGHIHIIRLFNTFLAMKRKCFEPLIHHILSSRLFELKSISSIKEAHVHYCWLQSLDSIKPFITAIELSKIDSSFKLFTK